LSVPSRRAAAGSIRRALLVLGDKAALEPAPEWFEEGEGIRVADEIVVDLVFKTCGETYDNLKRFEERIEIEGTPVRTVNLEGLLRTKQSSREQDVIDRAAIERALESLK
jgi:hypothetical protein